MNGNHRPWSEEDWTTLKRMRAEGESWTAIDKALGRAPRTSRSKWENEQGKERARADKAAGAIRPTPAEHQSLTAAFFGDPLPGRSALDRRQAVVSNRSISLAEAQP
ncbi:hypothetical protein MA20_32035 [Bradyrhizobium japonicum]|uniref:Myb-like domain-containing protein n=1 Tax=Bradyrhizobium japonicum TaxID=375 RepID=A0A0A3XRN4_BRAJP|nr:hypothetical protein [Bradyrhizobium japonicum]KGT75821.1 hypothetical protein MA20_32035 [Bradyrhizobium japonicum]